MATLPREQLLDLLRRDLVGPQGADDEIITSRPSDIYLTGILYPKPPEDREASAEDEEDRDTAEDDDGSPGESIGMASMRRPNMMGISFSVTGDAPVIEIRGKAAIYRPMWRKDDGSLSTTLVPKGAKVWQRVSVELSVTLEVVENLTSVETGDGLKWWVRGIHTREARSGRDAWQVTIALTNELAPGQVRDEIEAATWFQIGFEARPVAPCSLVPRASRQALTDEDSLANAVIYRDAHEWAVGHTCAATWTSRPRAELTVIDVVGALPEEEDARVQAIRTSWLPLQVVPTTSADGHGFFREESTRITGTKTDAFDASYLATAEANVLVAALDAVPAAYERWLQDEESRIATLEAGGRLDAATAAQARKHLTTGRDALVRLRRGIGVLAVDPAAREAFQLAQRAMCIQRRWAYPSRPEMMWRPFQLGFQLLTIAGMAVPMAADGSASPERQVMDLLWFPTGGGKTEAYLGLTAFTLFLRRLRNGGTGGEGVAVLMRYTLRLLTVQQFERAARLVLACDHLRRTIPQGTNRLGPVAYSIGLWVGSGATPNSLEEATTPDGNERARQLARCPGCGAKLDAGFHWSVRRSGSIVRCEAPGCDLRGEPLGVWTIDEEIYRHRPSLIIGTVDKFAQVTRNPNTASLLGSDGQPPELIIQDELHLISGPLGTVFGIYEAAIDLICTRNGVPPKVIGSTATIRRAGDQVLQLFNRSVLQFPPPILDAADSCFAVTDTEGAGRLYCGVTTAGRSPKFSLQAVCASLMQAAFEIPAKDLERDPYWTLVTYFNSLRELGGALVMMQDDVDDSIGNYAALHGSPRRDLVDQPKELTSRVDQAYIPRILVELEAQYPNQDIAAVLATNMISVGVDVSRLGLMVVNGQPKSMAEYIQATSRVGRGGVAGLVVTVYNVGRPRDRSHFEAFRTWHQTLYREVEASSVTPFAPRARDRALHAAVVALARHVGGSLRANPLLKPAGRVVVEGLIDRIVERASAVDPGEAADVRTEALAFLDEWESRLELEDYWHPVKHATSLLASLEDVATAKVVDGHWKFRARGTPNSMRNVEAETSLRLTETLRWRAPEEK